MVDFEPFAPIEGIKKKGKSPLEEKEEEIRQLRKELFDLQNQNRELKKQIESVKFALGSQIRRLEEERKHLLEQIDNLKAENEKLKQDLKGVSELLERLQRERENLLKLSDQLKEKINKNLEKLKSELLDFWEKVTITTLKELLNIKEFQNEEMLRKLFREIFEDKLFLGEIEVKANPEDVPILREILTDKSGITFTIKPDPSLKRGELEVETDKFFVERKYDELIPQILRETMEKLLRERENING